ncbi:TonB-dependent receptor [Mucilaginibacter sp. PAMB04168]|uniref:SusC/RagA family TonB-linked outer membrane protein n=1 Tax=Mucilaginibacter sp. PAMB04168 TaxID=3138567 RepID=UPI0031F6326D
MRKIFTLIICLLITQYSIVLAQSSAVQGRVSDKAGEPLVGVTVKANGTTNTTITDVNGKYSITPAVNGTLTFSYIGFASQTVTIGGQSVVNVTLTESQNNLNDVVVVGYGTQKKSVVTGAISGVRASDLENQPVIRIEQSLQGRASGLTIASNSGQPGAASTVRLRGFTSLGNGKNEPLWVIDGVVIDNGGIGYLNQDDIESIEVLKDAASAAIYGTRAAAGVILVSTKKGKAGTMNINYNGYYGTQRAAKKVDLLNATEYATLRNLAFTNNPANANRPLPFPNPSQYGEGTDWQSVIFNNSAPKQIHEFSVSGGSEKATFFTSFSYYDIKGIVATPISKANRANIRLNSTYKPAKWISFGENLGYAHGVNSGIGETNREYGGVLSSAVNLDPLTPVVITDPASQGAFFPAAPPAGVSPTAAYTAAVRDQQGRFYGISPYVANEMRNPLAYIQTRLGNYAWDHNIVGNAFLDIEPVKGLRFHSSLGTKLAFYGSETFNPSVYFNTSSSVQPNSLSRANNYLINWNIENTLSYNRAFGKHNLTLLLGHGEYKDNNTRGTTVTYSNIPATNFDEASFRFNALQANRTSEGRDGTDHRINSLFSRVQYNYDEKYLLTALIRRDGSSRFGANNKFGYFPSASVGWVPTLESFFPKNDVVTFLKLRGSYGVTGNDGIGDFAFVSQVDAGGQRNYTFGTSTVESINIGYSPGVPENRDLRWEETSQLDLGFDATLFQNLTVAFDVYKKKTTGILQNPPIPGYAGYGSFAQNAADIENKGLELELGYRKKIGDFNFGVNGNVSFYKNKVTKLLPGIQFINDNNATFQTLGDITRTGLNRPYNQFFGYETLGIFQSQAEIDRHVGADGVTKLQPNARPGDLKYANLNNDNTINGDDRDYIGNPNPTMSYGLTINLAYKNFDFTAFGSGVGGNKVFQGLRRLDLATANYQTKYLNTWSPTNTSATLPRLSEGENTFNYTRLTNLYLENGSYFRLRTIQLGYNLPSKLISKISMKKLRVYVLSENLFTITKYSGYDPELGVSADAGGGAVFSVDRGAYPQARTFLFGVNVGF